MAKVSVGIPTYNRPEGLERTLSQILSQSFTDLEIIVSNNCSTDPRVADVANKFSSRDKRLRIINQKENIGIVKNFLEVLSQSSGDFFMWAADDDEWHPDFIATCVGYLETHKVGSVMTGFNRNFRSINSVVSAVLPVLTGEDRFVDANLFFDTMPHSIFYGLHRRSTLSYLLDRNNDAWVMDDEYIILRQIIENGFLTVPQVVMYEAGVNEYPYKIKLPREAHDKQFIYYKRIIHFVDFVCGVESLSDLEKMSLIQRYVLQKIATLLNFESEIRAPEQYALAQKIHNFISMIDVRKLSEYSDLFSAVNKFRS